MAEVQENNLLKSLLSSGVSFSGKEEAIRSIAALSFPTRKTEDWRYTSVSKIIKKQYIQGDGKAIDISNCKIAGLDVFTVVLVNGMVSKELSTIENSDIVIDSIANAIEKNLCNVEKTFNRIAKNSEEVFTAVNTGYFSDGVFIHVAKNKKVDKPVHIIHISTGDNVVSNPRVLVIAEAFAEVNIIQTYSSENGIGCFTNAVTEVMVGDNAKVIIDKIQQEKEQNSLICTEQVYQEKNSSFKINTITLSGDFVRNGVNVEVDGENCSSEMNGLYVLKGKQHVDNHTKVNHLKPNCTSTELYKGVLYDKSTGVFNGKVIVHEDAQKIEAYQQNKNILISRDATMNAKPELEIYADDVKCSHGTTTGQFDEEAIFYLQARGVSESSAKKLLVEAFAGEVLEKIDNEILREWLISRS